MKVRSCGLTVISVCLIHCSASELHHHTATGKTRLPERGSFTAVSTCTHGASRNRQGQTFRPLCPPPSRRLHRQLLPPFTGADRQGYGSPSPWCRRYYRLDRTKYRRALAHNLQAKWQECRSVGRFRLHPDYTAGVHFSFEQTVVRVFMSPNANRKECH